MADAVETVETGGIPLTKITEVYLKIKAKREKLSTEYNEADDKLVRQQDKIKSTLLRYLKENDIKSVKTDAGTFYRTVKQTYWTSDWEQMHKFIMKHEVPEFLEKRLNQTAVREYLEENPDVAAAGLDGLTHYLCFGAAEGRDPNPLFSTTWYVERNPDVDTSRLNPLLHSALYGAFEGRDPSPGFDTAWYGAENSEVARTRLTPLAHYLQFGRAEDRPPRPAEETSGASSRSR